jgi:uridine kinase
LAFILNNISKFRYEYIFLEGFLIYRDQDLSDILEKKYFLVLNKEECLRRRLSRIYKTFDSMPYFEKVVWAEFIKYKSFCETNYTDITFLSGSNSKQQIFQFVISDLQSN